MRIFRCVKKSESSSSLKWIIAVTGSYRYRVALILLIETVQALCSLALAIVLKNFVNGVVAKDAAAFHMGVAKLLLLLFLLIGLGSVLRFLKEYTSTAVNKKFQMWELQEIMNRSYSAVSEIHSGEWMNRINSDAEVVSSGVTNILPNVFSMCVRLVGALLLLIHLLPEVAFVIIPGGILLGVLTFLFRGKLKKLHREQQEAQGIFRVFLQERLQNLLVIHSFSKEKSVMEEGEKCSEQYRRKHIQKDNFSNLCNVGFGMVMNGAYILGICYCGYRIFRGTLEYGTLIAVMNLVAQVQSPFANLSGYVPQYYSMLASGERLMEIGRFVDAFAKPPIPKAQVRSFYEQSLKAIHLRNVSFSYIPDASQRTCCLERPSTNLEDESRKKEERKVFDHFSVTIPRGSVVAVTGPSGSGKSTLLKILMCLYPVEQGSCVLETKDAERPLDSSWRGLYSYVPQGNQLMAGTIREIVTFQEKDRFADDEGIWKALREADAEDFVRELPEQLDAQLGEHGSGLSEGQVQRLAIARALYAGHPILLLDESTSSLDELTEYNVLSNIKRRTNCTVILVTHRKAPLGICDMQINIPAK